MHFSLPASLQKNWKMCHTLVRHPVISCIATTKNSKAPRLVPLLLLFHYRNCAPTATTKFSSEATWSPANSQGRLFILFLYTNKKPTFFPFSFSAVKFRVWLTIFKDGPSDEGQLRAVLCLAGVQRSSLPAHNTGDIKKCWSETEDQNPGKEFHSHTLYEQFTSIRRL